MTSVAHPPRLTTDAAERAAAEIFGIIGRATSLPSERDQNFAMACADGRRFGLKIANAGESRALLEAENAVMRHLAGSRLVPALLPTREAHDLGETGGHLVRLVTWIDGRPLGETARQTDG